MSFSVTAKLFLSAEWELQQETWSLFAPGALPDDATFKKTVYLVQREGAMFAIENLQAKFYVEGISHYEADLIQLHNRSMGSPDFFNPFALVYAFNSAKPASAFPVGLEPLFSELAVDAGSNASATLNPSISEPQEPPLPTIAYWID